MAVQESDCTESEIFWAALIDCSVTSSYVKDWRRGWGGGESVQFLLAHKIIVSIIIRGKKGVLLCM